MHIDSWAWKMLLQVLGVCVLQEVQAVTTFVSSSEAPSWQGERELTLYRQYGETKSEGPMGRQEGIGDHSPVLFVAQGKRTTINLSRYRALSKVPSIGCGRMEVSSV